MESFYAVVFLFFFHFNLYLEEAPESFDDCKTGIGMSR